MHITIVLLLSVVSAGTDSCTPSKCNASIEDADDEVSLLHHYSKISRSGSREMQKVAHSSNSESLTVPIRKAAASTEWYTIPVENFSTYTTRAQYGETVAHDGKIYFTPHDASEFLILDTATDVLSVVPTDSILPEPSAGHWLGITIYEGKIYCAPATAEQLLVYDPQTLSLSGVPTSPVFTGAAKWNGVAGWDKKIYAAPMNPEVLLVVDLVTNNVSGVSTSSVCSGGGKWMGLIAHSGKLYSAPVDTDGISGCEQLLVYDTASGKVSGVSTASVSTGPWKWHGMTILGSKIYAVPAGATAILIYDTLTGEVSGASTEHIDKGEHKWAGMTSYEGKIYGGPQQNGKILVYDPETKNVSSLSVKAQYDSEFAILKQSALPPSMLSGSKMLCWNGIAAWGGKLYSPPYDARTVLVYKLHS